MKYSNVLDTQGLGCLEIKREVLFLNWAKKMKALWEKNLQLLPNRLLRPAWWDQTRPLNFHLFLFWSSRRAITYVCPLQNSASSKDTVHLCRHGWVSHTHHLWQVINTEFKHYWWLPAPNSWEFEFSCYIKGHPNNYAYLWVRDVGI